MKSLEKKDWIIALLVGLLIGAILSTPLIYTVSKLSSDIPRISDVSDSTATSSSPSVQEQVENIIRIPIDIAYKNRQTQLAKYQWVNVRVTFYTGLARENGGFAKMNAIGGKLKPGSLAAPKDIPFGTTFVINDLPPDAQLNTFSVDDRGSAITWINKDLMKVDVYIKRNPGENDSTYYERVNDLGVIYTKAKYRFLE